MRSGDVCEGNGMAGCASALMQYSHHQLTLYSEKEDHVKHLFLGLLATVVLLSVFAEESRVISRLRPEISNQLCDMPQRLSETQLVWRSLQKKRLSIPGRNGRSVHQRGTNRARLGRKQAGISRCNLAGEHFGHVARCNFLRRRS